MTISIPAMLLRLACCLATILFLAPATAQGQAAEEAPDSAAVVAWLRRLCPGQELMVSTSLRERVAGECRELQDARLVVRQGADSQSLPLVGMDSVWVREDGTRSGAVTGAAIGGAVFGALGVLLVAVVCDFDCRLDMVRYGFGAAAGGAFSGAVAGGLIGSGRKVWTRVHPR